MGIWIEGRGKAEHGEALKAINVTGQITKPCSSSMSSYTDAFLVIWLNALCSRLPGVIQINHSAFKTTCFEKIIKTTDKLLTVQFITMPTAVFAYISKNSPQINFLNK